MVPKMGHLLDVFIYIPDVFITKGSILVHWLHTYTPSRDQGMCKTVLHSLQGLGFT